MNKINKFITENKIMRRCLVFAITFIFLKTTLNIFDGIVLDTFKVAAYGLFCGLETLIVKFYLSSTEEESKGD